MGQTTRRAMVHRQLPQPAKQQEQICEGCARAASWTAAAQSSTAPYAGCMDATSWSSSSWRLGIRAKWRSSSWCLGAVSAPDFVGRAEWLMMLLINFIGGRVAKDVS